MVDTAGDFHAAINAMLETLGAGPAKPAPEKVGVCGAGWGSGG
ncbi:phosphoglycolate phosphatase [Ralstonia solanacearum]|nr:phosphoglycolate phosphatase [Ralstonia solanacearum]